MYIILGTKWIQSLLQNAKCGVLKGKFGYKMTEVRNGEGTK